MTTKKTSRLETFVGNNIDKLQDRINEFLKKHPYINPSNSRLTFDKIYDRDRIFYAYLYYEEKGPDREIPFSNQSNIKWSSEKNDWVVTEPKIIHSQVKEKEKEKEEDFIYKATVKWNPKKQVWDIDKQEWADHTISKKDNDIMDEMLG